MRTITKLWENLYAKLGQVDPECPQENKIIKQTMKPWRLLYCGDNKLDGIECDDVQLLVKGTFESEPDKIAYCNKMINTLTYEYQAIHERKKVVNYC